MVADKGDGEVVTLWHVIQSPSGAGQLPKHPKQHLPAKAEVRSEVGAHRTATNEPMVQRTLLNWLVFFWGWDMNPQVSCLSSEEADKHAVKNLSSCRTLEDPPCDGMAQRGGSSRVRQLDTFFTPTFFFPHN